MTHSPWVQTTTIRRTWVPVSHEWVQAPQQEISGGVRSAPGVTGNTANVSSGTTREGEPSEIEVNIYVYWESSRVMRAATARQKVLLGETKDSEAEPYARAQQDEYELVLSMADMTPFRRKDEKFFQGQTFLQMRRGKLKLPPTHVVYQKDASGTLKQAVFFFPKKASAGEPTIRNDETDVEFTIKIADSTLRFGFRPQKMTDQSGPDL